MRRVAMIGRHDVGPIFGIADGRKPVSRANSNHIGALAFWFAAGTTAAVREAAYHRHAVPYLNLRTSSPASSAASPAEAMSSGPARD
ncbi:MAG: hypothetical protein V7603_129 [Micromonosporaceae bacterium]